LDYLTSHLPVDQNSTAANGTNGVPLGGNGTGCVEIVPDGKRTNSLTTNYYSPIVQRTTSQ
jgi:uncharacterized protein (DUF608 family)